MSSKTEATPSKNKETATSGNEELSKSSPTHESSKDGQPTLNSTSSTSIEATTESNTDLNINLTVPTAYNPISEWEEPIDIPFLTLFDMHRKPRKMITEKDSEICLPLRVLSSEFHCPVCLGYMKKTSIVMECLHRFCGECIQKCLRLGKKECPSCRIHIPSRRSLRPDPNFDNLICNIYGDINKLEEYEEKKIANLNKAKNMNNAYSESRKRGIMAQAIHRKKKLRESTSSNAEDNERQPVEEIIAPSIDFVLRRHPQETLVDCLKREFIRTSSTVTIKHIKTFLSRKLDYQHENHFQILTISGDEGVIVDDNLTMSEVQKDICNSSDNIILHFRVVPK